jgi:serine/threonine protein kinase
MKSMNCPNIIRLFDINEDPNYVYLILEYCEGGDLINYQGNLKGKVFNLK